MDDVWPGLREIGNVCYSLGQGLDFFDLWLGAELRPGESIRFDFNEADLRLNLLFGGRLLRSYTGVQGWSLM
jgi:hypothetical protein